MTRLRLLLILCGVMVTLVIVGLAIQADNLSTRVQALTEAQEKERARKEAALELAGRAMAGLEAADPEKARALEVEMRIVRDGDLRLLEPAKHQDLIRLFDEML